MNTNTKHSDNDKIGRPSHRCDGSVMIITLMSILILVLAVGTTLLSTTNKYFTAYQWASWQEALQGAESGADLAMAEMRKDIRKNVAWAGWNVGKYKVVNGIKTTQKDPATYKAVSSEGKFLDNSGGGAGNSTTFNIAFLTDTPFYDFATYSTNLTAHEGEGNTNLRISVTLDAPSTLLDPSGRRWLRVRATGTTDMAGPVRASEEKLDNRLRKLGLFFDKVLNQSVVVDPSTAKKQTTRQIELVAKPVSLFAGALTSMVQIKSDDQGLWTDSFNSEDRVNWPIIKDNNNFEIIDMTVSHDPKNALGKNGDIASNAFPVKHDHGANLDLKTDIIYGDVGNNYSQIKKLDPTYYSTPYDPVNNPFGLNNGNYGSSNPTPSLIKTDGGADVSGIISTNYFRDLPPIQDPTWASYTSYAKIDKDTHDVDNISTNPTNPTQIKAGSLTLAGGDKWTLKAPPPKSGWTTATPPLVGYVEIWVTGDIKLDDGGTVVIQTITKNATNPATGQSQEYVQSYVQAKIFFDHNVKVGETKETKSNSGGFDVQSDDAKDLLLFGVTQPDNGKLPKDAYTDPLGNEALYTPYKASGNIVFKENDFTGAIYAPDHNIVFDNVADGRGKRHKRKQGGADFYGSYVGRTINNKKGINVHFDESLNDAGPVMDYGYVSWFEDVDVDRR